MGELSPWHWIVVLLIFALLFGSRKLPDAARGLGRSLRIFKAEMTAAKDGFQAEAAPAQPAAAADAPAAGTAAPVQDAIPPASAFLTPTETAAPAAKPPVDH